MSQLPEAPETSELAAFVRIVDSRSLTRAAAELQVPRATVSRRLARLEEKLGVRLLRRTTRSIALTDAGERFVTHARSVLEAVSLAENAIRREPGGAPRGPVRLSVPQGLGREFHRFVADFAARHPDLQVQVLVTTDLVDLVKDNFDLAIRASSVETPGVVTRRVARDLRVAVASPAWLKANGTPRTRADLRRHRCLVNFTADRLPASEWPTLDGGRVHVNGVMVSNDIALLREAALEGMGITLMPMLFVRHDLEAGRLVRVLPNVVGAEVRVLVAWPDREFTPAGATLFRDELLSWIPALVSAVSARGAD